MTRRIDRREALGWIAGAPFVGRVFRSPRFDRVVVIGAGVLGAATACRLASRGAHVVLCEKERARLRGFGEIRGLTQCLRYQASASLPRAQPPEGHSS